MYLSQRIEEEPLFKPLLSYGEDFGSAEIADLDLNNGGTFSPILWRYGPGIGPL